MSSFNARLKELRKEKGFSQNKIANDLEVSYSQYSRYELGNSQPSGEVLQKLADYYNTTIDFLINGNTDEKAISTIKDNELLKHFSEVDKLPSEEKNVVLKFVGAYLRDFKTRKAYSI